MRILLYGGGFNPPHLGHTAALNTARAALRPDLTLVLPDGEPPHKPLPAASPSPEERLRLCSLAFPASQELRVSTLALFRRGPCYMIDTVRLLRRDYPEDELILLLGGDMLLCFDSWRAWRELLSECRLVALRREDEAPTELENKLRELERLGSGKGILLEHRPVPISSSALRRQLREREGAAFFAPEVYGEIIRLRLYGAKPQLSWLREQIRPMLNPRRVAHVEGCEQLARTLALRWGMDPDLAAEAGILHDMTKRWSTEEQLRYCAEKGISLDADERANPLLLHARTGAVAAGELFGAPEEVCEAIRWHTTGKPGMSLFEKILYLADSLEPNRDYPGVEEMRKLALEDLDAAMGLALRRSVQSIRQRGLPVYKDTLEASAFYAPCTEEIKEEYPC